MGTTILVVLHYVLCLGLILIILLQADKGGGLAAAFGGGSSETIFGARRGNVLTRITAISVGLFMVTSILLTIILPKQASVIQKKGIINEGQMQDVKRPQVPGIPAGVPPSGQPSPAAPPAETQAVPEAGKQTPPAPETQQQAVPQAQKVAPATQQPPPASKE